MSKTKHIVLTTFYKNPCSIEVSLALKEAILKVLAACLKPGNLRCQDN